MSILADAIKAVDPAPNKKTELTLALNLISELAENKAKEFEMEIKDNYRTAGTIENRTAPITTIIASHEEYRAFVKSDVGKIATEVASAIKKFVSGGTTDIIDGVADLVTTGMEAILGAGEATQQEMRSYYITAQARALVRYDILAWKRTVEATGITSQIEACMAVYASKASIDVQKLDLNTFLLAYENQLTKMNFSEAETLKYIDEAEAIYYKLRGDNNNIKTSNTNVNFSRMNSKPKPSSPGEIVFYSK